MNGKQIKHLTLRKGASPMLTMKQYLASGSTHCPVCGRDHIEGGSSVDIEGNLARLEVWCIVCGAEWYDEYHLTRCVVIHEDGTAEPLI